MKATEANLLSFHILFDTKGRLVTETSGLPIAQASKVFKGKDLKIIETVIREARRKILQHTGLCPKRHQHLGNGRRPALESGCS